MWQVGLKISWLTRWLLLCPDLLLQSLLLPNLYHLRCYRKTITKRFTRELLCCWDGQIFSHQFLVVPEYPTPLLGRDLSLPSKSCSYCSPDRRCFKTLSWGQTIFTSHQVNNSWMGEAIYGDPNQRILRCQVVLMENLGLTMSLCEILNPATLLPTPRALSPFTLT